MSKGIIGQTEIRNKLILKKALEEMGISYKELSDETMSWGESYNKMTIDLNTGEISYDNAKQRQVKEIQQMYSKQFIMQEILKKGHKVESVNTVDGNIEIIAGY